MESQLFGACAWSTVIGNVGERCSISLQLEVGFINQLSSSVPPSKTHVETMLSRQHQPKHVMFQTTKLYVTVDRILFRLSPNTAKGRISPLIMAIIDGGLEQPCFFRKEMIIQFPSWVPSLVILQFVEHLAHLYSD